MDKNYSHNISIILDTRREKLNEKYPVKLRVYSKAISKAKLFNTGIDLTKEKYKTIWIEGNSINLRGKNRETRIRLQKIETRANDEAEKLNLFSFEKFERKFFRRSSDSNNVYFHYDNLIKEYNSKGKIGSSESFKYSLKSIKNFNIHYTGKELTNLPFENINVDWLEAYEKFMLSKGKSVTSIGIYLRALRIVFNNTIDDNDISKEIYPFGKKKFQIPMSNKVKKALSGEELRILFNSVPKTPEQEKSKDYWFFSYMSSGMNLKDILLLKYSDLDNEKFSYYRAKTFSKSRTKSKIVIYLNDYTKGIIEKYGTNESEGFVFPLIQNSDSE
ncbi:MAG: site-specific integrase, partial [Flavobacteriaceae bacterium]|nr:site-specific integrase [Flavobacteriaceae bacterium]